MDWKSDVNPSAATLDHYRKQVATYLEITGARHGLIVLMSSGTVLEVVLRPLCQVIPEGILALR